MIKQTVKRVAAIILTLIVLIVVAAVIYKTFDEKLSPETAEFLKLTPQESAQIQESNQFFDSIKNETLSFARGKSCPKKQDTKFIQEWEEYLKANPEYKTRLSQMLILKSIAAGGDSLAHTLATVNKSRNFIRLFELYTCYLEQTKQQDEANILRQKLALLVAESLNAPQLILSSLILSGITQSLVDELKKHPDKNKIFFKQLRPIVASYDVNQIFLKSARMDIITFTRTIGDERSIEDFQDKFLFKVLHFNKLKNELVKNLLEGNFEIPELPSDILAYWPSERLKIYKIVIFSRFNDSRDHLQMKIDKLKESI